MRPADLGDRTTHPRLFVLVLVGLAGLGLGAGLTVLVGDAGSRPDIGLRVGFFGFLVLASGLAGYVALDVFDHRPKA